ncbi:MAG TPA: TadE/TadG family type IV pilus assembly protein [Acidimicrobiales bacterium]|nr:TadE/TadG family type IV pilus assembly protein [Acidimicrobiales bacterium]
MEAAFVTPVFFMLIFGIVEVGLAMNDNLALAHSVRAGSRMASASGNEAYADYGLLRAIAREGSAIPRDQVERIVVYEATGPGALPTVGCRDGSPSSVAGNACNVYTPADFDRPRTDFGCLPDKDTDRFFCPSDRNIVLTKTTGPDYVGVWMKVEHPWVTRMFGSTLTLTDSSVIQLEPRERA